MPLAAQVQVIKQLKTSAEILKFSKSAILAARPVFDSGELIADMKLNILLKCGLEVANEVSIGMNKELIKRSVYYQQGKLALEMNSERMTDCEKTNLANVFEGKVEGEMKFAAIESFEDFWNIVNWKKDECLVKENSEWLMREAEKLILHDKVDLLYVSLVHRFLCEKIWLNEPLFEFFDRIISSYLHSLLPEELLIVLEGYSKLSNLGKNSSSTTKEFEKLTTKHFPDFSTEQLLKYVKFANIFNIPLTQEVIHKAKLSAVSPHNPDHLYILIKYKKFVLSPSALQDILQTLSLPSKLYLAHIFHYLEIEDPLFESLLISITQSQERFDIKKIYDLTDFLLHKKNFLQYCLKLALSFEPYLDSMDLYEYKKLLEIFCILKHADLSIEEELLEKLTKRFNQFTERVNYQNFSIFTHFFAYSMPRKAIHQLLCRAIINCEKPDSIQTCIPDHEYYETISQGTYLVYTNSLLTPQSLNSLLDILICLPFRYQVPSSVFTILKKYLKLLLTKFYFQLSVKFKSKLAIMLSNPDNFDKELIDLLLNKIPQHPTVHKSLTRAYPFMQAVRNLKNLSYTHPAFTHISELTHESSDLSE